MAREIINIGASAGDGSGDTLRNGGDKINSNFTELYTKVINSKLANQVFAGPSAGGSSEPNFRSLVSNDLGTGIITTDKLNDGAVTLVKLASSLQALLIPVATITPYAGSSAPTNWLLCNGAAVSRSTYADLFSAIGTTYGVGDGSTTFNLPDLRGRTPVGVDSSAGRVTANNTLGATAGAEKHTLTVDEMPAHTHETDRHFSFGTGIGPNGVNAQTSGVTGSTGGGNPHNNMQPYLVVNYIIKH
jgi:microcystin-dependent protein